MGPAEQEEEGGGGEEEESQEAGTDLLQTAKMSCCGTTTELDPPVIFLTDSQREVEKSGASCAQVSLVSNKKFMQIPHVEFVRCRVRTGYIGSTRQTGHDISQKKGEEKRCKSPIFFMFDTHVVHVVCMYLWCKQSCVCVNVGITFMGSSERQRERNVMGRESCISHRIQSANKKSVPDVCSSSRYPTNKGA